MMNALRRLRSYCIFVPLVFLYTGVLGIFSLLCSLLEGSGKIQHSIARLWSKMILATVGAPVTTMGLDEIDTTKPHLYVFNHLSAVDIPVIYTQLRFPFRIMAKKELFRYPFLGWHLRRSGQIPIESESALSSMRSMNRAVQTLREGMPLVVFPEGGRSEDGRVQPFMRGAFYAAIKAQVEIIPVALVGTFEMLPMNSFFARPRPLQMIVGAPISTAGYSTRGMETLAAAAQSEMEDLYYAHASVSREPKSGTPLPAIESNAPKLEARSRKLETESRN